MLRPTEAIDKPSELRYMFAEPVRLLGGALRLQGGVRVVIAHVPPMHVRLCDSTVPFLAEIPGCQRQHKLT